MVEKSNYSRASTADQTPAASGLEKPQKRTKWCYGISVFIILPAILVHFWRRRNFIWTKPIDSNAIGDTLFKPIVNEVGMAFQWGMDSDTAQINIQEIGPMTFQKAQNLIRETRQMLVEYYGDEQLMLNMFGGQKYLDDFDKVLTDKFTHSLLTKQKLSFGMIGSSVMAGHDNCHYDKYSEQFYRMLKPIFAELPFTYEVNNAGITGVCGDSFRNRVWCLEHLVGDADTVHGIWHFFGWHNDIKSMESYIRWALMRGTIPASGHIGIFNDLGNVYGKQGYQQFNLGALLDHTKAGRGWGQIGDGLHNTTRYGELPGVSKARQASLGVNMRNWHPGPLTFQYVSDVFFYTYMNALDEALQKIADMPPDARTSYPEPKYTLPEAKYLQEGDIALIDTPPHCLIGEDPTFGESAIKVLNGTEVPGKYRGIGGWERFFGSYEMKIPGAEFGQPECFHIDRCGGWRSVGKNYLSLRFPKLNKGILLVCGSVKQELEIVINDNVIPTFNASVKEPVTSKCWKVENIPQAAFQDDFYLHLSSTSETVTHTIDDIISA